MRNSPPSTRYTAWDTAGNPSEGEPARPGGPGRTRAVGDPAGGLRAREADRAAAAREPGAGAARHRARHRHGAARPAAAPGAATRRAGVRRDGADPEEPGARRVARLDRRSEPAAARAGGRSEEAAARGRAGLDDETRASARRAVPRPAERGVRRFAAGSGVLEPGSGARARGCPGAAH